MYEFTCEHCGGNVRNRQVDREALRHKGNFVILEDVPIGVCDTCGARCTSMPPCYAVRQKSAGAQHHRTERLQYRSIDTPQHDNAAFFPFHLYLFQETRPCCTMIVAAAAIFSAASLFAADKTVSFPPGKSPAVTLTVPGTAKVTSDDKGKTTIDTSKFNLYLWSTKAKTIDNEVKAIAKTVKSEVVNLKIEKTRTIKVAGADAKHLMGKSNEADDNDPGTTDIVVFMSGGKVIVACIHGENDFAEEPRGNA